ncbi:MAG: fluoride efflux transporter CrcB [Planctomycetaceae bacterium]|nr:fluoride efflux transporter CrcB [Planctomycetaceae bacterium]
MRHELMHLLAVGVGGFVGAVLRFLLSGLPQRLVLEKFGRVLPVGTLLVNVIGCLLIGVLMSLVLEQKLTGSLRYLLITGCLGSLTTFSTFGWETLELLREEQFQLAFLNVAANVLVGLFAVWAGFSLMRALT